MSDSENVSPAGAKQVLREMRELLERPPPGVRLLDEDSLACVRAELSGPEGTPYEGGIFRLSLTLGPRFPQSAPRAVFVTRVFHPNVSETGAVCVDTLARGWSPALGLRHALTAVRCLLIEPNPESALNAEAAALLRDHYELYCSRARLYTQIHARPGAEERPALKREKPVELRQRLNKEKKRVLKRL